MSFHCFCLFVHFFAPLLYYSCLYFVFFVFYTALASEIHDLAHTQAEYRNQSRARAQRMNERRHSKMDTLTTQDHLPPLKHRKKIGQITRDSYSVEPRNDDLMDDSRRVPSKSAPTTRDTTTMPVNLTIAKSAPPAIDPPSEDSTSSDQEVNSHDDPAPAMVQKAPTIVIEEIEGTPRISLNKTMAELHETKVDDYAPLPGQCVYNWISKLTFKIVAYQQDTDSWDVECIESQTIENNKVHHFFNDCFFWDLNASKGSADNGGGKADDSGNGGGVNDDGNSDPNDSGNEGDDDDDGDDNNEDEDDGKDEHKHGWDNCVCYLIFVCFCFVCVC